MRWHHYAGLLFGIVTTTWIFSGLLSMDPWNWHPGTSPTREQRQRVSGGPIVARDLTVERLRRVVKAFAPSWPTEVEIVRFRGKYFASAASGIVSFDAPQFGPQDQVPADQIVGAANIAMPGLSISLLSTPALGHRGDRAEHRRDRT